MTLVTLNVNGRALTAEAEPRTHLADFLRETHNLTGTHIGCEHGVCGACTLIIDGEPARSCITYAVACDNAEVTTIEGLDDDEVATQLRAAFRREHALQCGFCTPGMMVSARDVVLRLPEASEHEVRVAMSGNLCRCTGYVGIVRAVLSVLAERREAGQRGASDARSRLGPVGSGHAGATTPAASAAVQPRRSGAQPAGARPTSSARGVPIEPDWTPQTTFTKDFTVAHPPEKVWDFFGDVSAVARCLPGASLVGTPSDEHVEGQIRVKVGPITADFRGVADISRDDATRSGRIIGAGRDTRSNSATRGLITYVLKPEDEGRSTRVEVSIGYTLTGMLAQFGRSGLVQDIAGRLIGAFVQNLEASLGHAGSGDGGEPAMVSELNAGGLVFSVIAERLKAFWNRIFGR
jgi:carbon-monoxide dehydrogenase small subunit